MNRVLAWIALSLWASGCSNAAAPQPLPNGPTGTGYYTVAHTTRTLNEPARELLPGFGFEITDATVLGGTKVAVSRLGQLIPFSDLKRAVPSAFRGVKDPDQNLRLAFAIRTQTPILAAPKPDAAVVSRLPKLAVVNLLSRDGPAGFYATAAGWIAAADVRVPTPSSPPAGVAANEMWIDVDLHTQSLVMYQGTRPTFATLISGGVGAPGTTFATPAGVHRIVAKLRSAIMDNLEHTNVAKYHYESVPFTQYIGKVALHGVFWHDDFGHPKSHGCINLSVADAAYLFDATSPQLANGTDSKRSSHGTVVQVRL